MPLEWLFEGEGGAGTQRRGNFTSNTILLFLDFVSVRKTITYKSLNLVANYCGGNKKLTLTKYYHKQCGDSL